MGETISYSGGDIPYVDRVVEITPDTPKPDSEAIGEMRVVRARMEWLDEENKQLRGEVERLREQARLREIDYWNLARELEEELGHKRSSSGAQ